MDYRSNNTYFDITEKVLIWISIALILIGGVLAILGGSDVIGFFGMVIGISFAVVGAVVLILDLGRRTNDNEIDSGIEKFIATLEDNARLKMNVEERHLHITQHYVFTNFDFDGIESQKCRRGGDGNIRSSRYSYTELFFLTEKQIDKVFIYKYKFSIIDDQHTEELIELPYDQLEKIELDDKTTKKILSGEKTETEIKYIEMKVSTVDKRVITFPVKNDAASDEAVALFNHMIEKRQSGVGLNA